MVKHQRRSHQRRSHQRGIHSSELDDGDTSDSEAESPSTPQQSRQLQWAPNVVVSPRSAMPVRHQLHGAHSFADFGQQQLEAYPLPQQYDHRHSFSGGPQAFNSPIPEHNPLISRDPNLPAHSNMNPPQLQTYRLPCHQQLQEVLQSDPSSYSPVSRASPIPGEPYYGQSTAELAICAILNFPLAEQVPAVQFQQQLAQPLAQQRCQPTPSLDGQWYENATYQSPVEVVGQIQAYQARISTNLWIQKIGTYDDISLQMPSMRIENL